MKGRMRMTIRDRQKSMTRQNELCRSAMNGVALKFETRGMDSEFEFAAAAVAETRSSPTWVRALVSAAVVLKTPPKTKTSTHT